MLAPQDFVVVVASLPTMPIARGPVQIHYEHHEGPGPKVVLLMGLSLSGRFWMDTPQRLGARDKPYSAIVPDNRGTGRSDKPGGRYKMADLADDVARVLDDAKVDRAFVVGVSLGGMITQHFALRHPSRVRGIGLLATTPGFPHGRPPPPSSLLKLVKLPFAKPGQMSRDALSILLSPEDVGRAGEIFRGWPELMQTERTPRHAFFGQLTAAIGHSTGFRLGEIRCPAVVVTGDADVLILPRNSATIASRIPGAELWTLPGVGHTIPSVDREVTGRVLDRLAEREAAGASRAA